MSTTNPFVNNRIGSRQLGGSSMNRGGGLSSSLVKQSMMGQLGHSSVNRGGGGGGSGGVLPSSSYRTR